MTDTREHDAYGPWVDEVRTAEEDLVFSLPRELRRDASGAQDPRALGGRS